jgi:hypothetical protein
MKIRLITEEQILLEYISGYYECIKTDESNIVKIEVSYLQRSDVYGIFDKDNVLVGGFALGMSTPYRLFELIPQNEKNNINTPNNFNLSDCCEVVCIWKNQSVSKYFTTIVLWPKIFNGVLKSKKKYLLGHSHIKKLNNLYSFLGPFIIYEGDSTAGLPSRLFVYSRIKVFIIRFFISTYFPVVRFIKSIRHKFK